MKRIIVSCAIAVLAFSPFAARADLIDAIRVGVAICPDTSPKAIEILDKIRKGATADEQAGLAREWETAFTDALAAKGRADHDRQAADDKHSAAMRAAVMKVCIRLRQRKVNAGFQPSDDGTALHFLSPGHGELPVDAIRIQGRAGRSSERQLDGLLSEIRNRDRRIRGAPGLPLCQADHLDVHG